jgi:hypothetical protein
MALSNIFNEPRREIIESIVGIAVVGGFVWVDYTFAIWLQTMTTGLFDRDSPGVPWLLGIVLGPIALVLIVIIANLAHMVGDLICDILQDRGIHLRPRDRS